MIHDEMLQAAFETLKTADFKIADLKTEQAQLDFRRGEADAMQRAALAEIDSLMKETGEYEVIIPGTDCDYKINYSTPRESLKIADDAAVPDEFCKIERVPKKREITEAIKSGSQFNWASLERGEPKIQYKTIKKGKSND
jgi:Siphovirus Gp157